MILVSVFACLPLAVGGAMLCGGAGVALTGGAWLAGCILGLALSAPRRWRRLSYTVAVVCFVAWGLKLLPGLKPGLLSLASGGGFTPNAVYFWTAVCAFSALRLSRGAVWKIPWMLLPSAVCAALTASPKPFAVGLYVLGLGLVLFPRLLTALRPEQGARLTVLLALPLVLASLAAGVLTRYAPDGSALRLNLISRAGSLALMQSYNPVGEADSVSLRHDAPPDGSRSAVLELTSRRGGLIYLRGRDYDVYTGTDWESSERFEEFGGWGEETDELSIHILGYENHLYLPYYPPLNTCLTNGVAVGSRLDYTFTSYSRGTALAPTTLGCYCRLPERTRSWAFSFLNGASTAEEIGDLVRTSFRYNKRTPAMPEGEADFVRWFASSGEGYCTHFASLAVVLLRTAGIPARYVTGFLVDAKPGEVVTVTLSQAHAWAEYYDYNLGAWRILETTPTAIFDSPGERNAERPNFASVLRKICIYLPTFALYVVYLVSRLRVGVRNARISRGSSRQKAYYLHAHAQMLANLLGETLPSYLDDLLERGLYSRDAPAAADLERFRVYCRQCLRRLRRKPLLKRLYHRLYLGAY